MPLADWDARLITPERALRLAGDWPVYATVEVAELSQFEPAGDAQVLPDRAQHNLRCHRCGQSVGLLPGTFLSGPTTAGDILSGILRHMVMAHDVPLNGG